MTRPPTASDEVAVRAPQQRLDPAHQLAQPERLGQVVVGAELEADDLVDLVVARGEDEDRHLGPGRADAAEDLEAVDPGQPDVEDDEVGRLVGRDVEALLAGAGDGDLVAFLLEGVLDATRDGVLVFDDEDGGGHAGDATPRGPDRRNGQLATTPRGTRSAASGRLANSGHRRRAAARDRPKTTPTRTSIQRFPTMPTARATLAAEHREITGKKVAASAAPASCPAVVYGHGVDSTNVTDRRPRLRAAPPAHRPERPGRPVGRRQEGRSRSSSTAIQVHPVNRRTLHVDLFLVRMTEELTVDVPLVATGESPAVTLQGGTLLHPIESVRSGRCPITCPQSIEYSVESLVDFDTTIHVRDLVVPSDVTLLTDGDEIIAKVQAPRVEEATVVGAAEAAEGEEAAAAEEAGAEAGEDNAAGLVRGLSPGSPRSRPSDASGGPIAKTIG